MPEGGSPRRPGRGTTSSALPAAAQYLRAWDPLLWVAMACAAAWVIGFHYAPGQNGDGLLQTLISLQQPTVFFWGQDRFANLLPLLTSSVTSPVANAYVQLGLRIGLGVLAPLLVCGLVAGRGERGPGAAWRASLTATALLLAFAPQRAIHEIFIEASPYGTSFALAGLALLCFGRAASHGTGALPLRALGLALTCAATLVNASLMLVATPLCAGCALLSRPALAAEFTLAGLLALGATAGVVALGAAGVSGTPFSLNAAGFAGFSGQIIGKPGLFFGSIALLVGATMLLDRLRGRIGSALAKQAVAVAVTFAVVLVALCASKWVAMNAFHLRYMVPLFVLTAALGGLALQHSVSGAGPGQHAALLALCAVLLVIAVRRSPPPPEEQSGIVAVAVRSVATAIADEAAAHGLDALAGDYWLTWPAVFLAEQRAHDAGRRVGAVFGVTYRGEVRRDAFNAVLRARGVLKLGCIDRPDPLDCQALVVATMQPPPMILRAASPPMALPGGHTLSIIALRLYEQQSGANP